MEPKHKPFAEKYMSKEMRRMIFKLMLLSEIKEKKRYPYELIELMADPKKAKFMGSKKSDIKNDIYNIVRMLEKSGYIKLVVSKKRSDKKYYSITPEGREALVKSKKLMLRYMKELVKLIK